MIYKTEMEHPFIDQPPIKVKISQEPMLHWSGKVVSDITFTMGNAVMVVPGIYSPPHKADDYPDLIEAAIAFAQDQVVCEEYENVIVPDEFRDILDYLILD